MLRQRKEWRVKSGDAGEDGEAKEKRTGLFDRG